MTYCIACTPPPAESYPPTHACLHLPMSPAFPRTTSPARLTVTKLAHTVRAILSSYERNVCMLKGRPGKYLVRITAFRVPNFICDPRHAKTGLKIFVVVIPKEGLVYSLAYCVYCEHQLSQAFYWCDTEMQAAKTIEYNSLVGVMSII